MIWVQSRKYVISETMSTKVVVIGPHITAGSSLTNLAKNGREQPTNLEIIMVTNNVPATNEATKHVYAV